jgi:Tfp pilus assembly protein FimT
MLIELLLYISLLSMLSGIAVPIVIDLHTHAYKTIDQIKEEYKA